MNDDMNPARGAIDMGDPLPAGVSQPVVRGHERDLTDEAVARALSTLGASFFAQVPPRQ